MTQERRHYPRYQFTRPLQISQPGTGSYPVQGNDLSEAGVSLRVSQAVMVKLSSEGGGLHTGSHFLLELPDEDNNTSPIACQVMHARRLSQDSYLVGAWYADPHTGQLPALRALLDNARDSAEDEAW